MNSERAASRYILTILIALVGALLPLHASASPTSGPHLQSAADPLVLAFYYTWFDENTLDIRSTK